MYTDTPTHKLFPCNILQQCDCGNLEMCVYITQALSPDGTQKEEAKDKQRSMRPGKVFPLGHTADIFSHNST